MNDLTIMEKIKNRINDAKEGSIFIANDFIDISSLETANRCLSRLCRDGLIRRLMRGIYDKPEYCKLIDEMVYPAIDDIAIVIAKKYGWEIAPSGNKSLNLLGLSTQVPAKCVYMSTGPYKEYRNVMDSKLSIVFMHTNNRDISHMTFMSKIIVQALKFKGKDNVHEDDIKHISSLLSKKERKVLLSETINVTSWVYEVIKKICSDSNK